MEWVSAPCSVRLLFTSSANYHQMLAILTHTLCETYLFSHHIIKSDVDVVTVTVEKLVSNLEWVQ